jgi:hypothetical protein
MRNTIAFLFLSFAFNGFCQSETITSFSDPKANGTLFLQVRNDSVKYICNTIKVENGVMIPCENNQIINYNYYIHRNTIDSNWLDDVLRLYDTWMEVPKFGAKGAWLNYEKKDQYTTKKPLPPINKKLELPTNTMKLEKT